jgi:hypothetical protein
VLEKQRRITTSNAGFRFARLPKAPGSQKRLSEDSSSVWRMRASMPVATVATQSVRHRSPEAAGSPNVSGPNRCEEVPESNAKQRHRSINREVNRTMVLGLINQECGHRCVRDEKFSGAASGLF